MSYNLADPANERLLRRIFYRRFAPGLEAQGMEADEVYQAVCLSMVVRDQGDNPYRAEKGSRSNYAYMVCRSVVSHASARHRRGLEREGLGKQGDAALIAS
jgi:hypothetical protein